MSGSPGSSRKTNPIHSWSPQDRPRERLRALGPAALSVRELVAILVGSGGTSGSALDLADRVLGRMGLAPLGGAGRDMDGSRGGVGAAVEESPGAENPRGWESLRRLATVPVGALESVSGVGAATAARILAALELGRRAATERPERDPPIRGPADVFERVGPLLRDLQQEEFHALLLNTQHRVIRDVLVTRGILDASLIHPREVFRAAIVESAAGVILVHNHPSGDPTPSQEDRTVTRQLVSAGSAVGIPVLDHVIVGSDGFVSLAERGGLASPRRVQ